MKPVDVVNIQGATAVDEVMEDVEEAEQGPSSGCTEQEGFVEPGIL